MKKKLLTIVSCLIIFACILTGCGAKALKGGPSASDTIYGNGGTVVRKGNYLYFANAYSTAAVDENDNKYGKETLSAIYRVKLNANGLVDTDDNGKVKNVEILAKQIAGFNQSGIYIFGDYIYYATPKSLKVKSDIGSEELLEGLLSFERVKLNGTKHKTVYSIKTKGEDLTYSYNYVDGKVCLTVLNNGKLTTVFSDGDTKTIATGVKSVVFPKVETIPAGYRASEFNSYVYYTRTATIAKDGYNGTLLAKKKITGNGRETVLENGTDKTLEAAFNDRLYFKKDSKLYSTADFNFDTATQYSANSLAGYKVVPADNGYDMGIVGVLNKSIVYYRGLGDYQPLLTTDKTITLLYIQDNSIYYTLGDDTLYSKVIYKNSYPADEEDIAGTIHSTGIKTSVSDTETVYDYEKDYFFYFNTVEDSNGKYKYMHFVKHFEKDSQGETFEQCIGTLASSDIKKDEE